MDVDHQRAIKPGEFTFCSRCGEVCRIGDEDWMCNNCQAYFFGKKRSEEQILYDSYLHEVGLACVRYRQRLAELRVSTQMQANREPSTFL